MKMRSGTFHAAFVTFLVMFVSASAYAGDEREAFECHKAASKAYLEEQFGATAAVARKCYLEHRRPSVGFLWLRAQRQAGGTLTEACDLIKQSQKKLGAWENERIGAWCSATSPVVIAKSAPSSTPKEDEQMQKHLIIQGDLVQGNKNVDNRTIINHNYAPYEQTTVQKVALWVGLGLLATSLGAGVVSGQNWWVYDQTATRSQALNRSSPSYTNDYQALRREREEAWTGGMRFGAAAGVGALLGFGSMMFAQWEFD